MQRECRTLSVSRNKQHIFPTYPRGKAVALMTTGTRTCVSEMWRVVVMLRETGYADVVMQCCDKAGYIKGHLLTMRRVLMRRQKAIMINNNLMAGKTA